MTATKQAYRKYLSSPEWRILRRQRLELDRYECVLCGSAAEHVHHRRYLKEWGEESIMDLVSLCGQCHERHHGFSVPRIKLPERIPPTREMEGVMQTIRDLETKGDEQGAVLEFAKYVNMRRAQIG